MIRLKGIVNRMALTDSLRRPAARQTDGVRDSALARPVRAQNDIQPRSWEYFAVVEGEEIVHPHSQH